MLSNKALQNTGQFKKKLLSQTIAETIALIFGILERLN